MQVRLSRVQQQFVQHLVDHGHFASADEVIARALEVFAREELRREIDLGLADEKAGRVTDWDVEEVKADLLRRMKRATKKKAS